jgi:hypothetical protein
VSDIGLQLSAGNRRQSSAVICWRRPASRQEIDAYLARQPKALAAAR